MLSFQNVYYSYKKANYVLQEISFDLPEHGFVLIKGKSGSGKTTLINLLSGLDVPTKGQIFFNGSALTKDKLEKYRQKEVSVVFQDLNLIRNLSIKDNLRIAFEASGFEYDETIAAGLFKNVGLDIKEINNRFPNELSGGQQQRIAILRALIKKPKAIILDEPTSALDYDNAEDILKILKRISNHMLVIVASHDLLRLEKLSSLVISLNEEGKKQATSEPYFIDNYIFNKKDRQRNSISAHSIVSFVFSLRYKNRFKIISSIFANALMLLLIVFSVSILFVDTNKSLLSGQKSMHSPYFLSTLQEKNGGSYQLATFDDEIENKMIGKGYARFSYVGKIMTSFYDDYSPYSNRRISFFTSYKNDNYAVELNDGLDFEYDKRVKNHSQHMPNDFHEIAITSSVADCLIDFSFDDRADESGYISRCKKYKDIEELLEKGYCYDKRITAVLETPDQNYLSFLDKNDSNSQKKWDGFTIAKCVFVKNGYNDWLQTQNSEYVDFSSYDRPLYMLGKMNGSVRNTIKEIKSFSFKKNQSEFEIKVNNLYNNYLFFSNEIRVDRYPGMVLLTIVFMLIMICFLNTSSLFSSVVKKDDISLGIMHSLGVNKKGLCSIVFFAVFLLLMIEAVIFTFSYILIWLIVNSFISSEFYFLQLLSLPLLFSQIIFVIVSIISVLPGLRKVMTTKPISIVRDYYK